MKEFDLKSLPSELAILLLTCSASFLLVVLLVFCHLSILTNARSTSHRLLDAIHTLLVNIQAPSAAAIWGLLTKDFVPKARKIFLLVNLPSFDVYKSYFFRILNQIDLDLAFSEFSERFVELVINASQQQKTKGKTIESLIFVQLQEQYFETSSLFVSEWKCYEFAKYKGFVRLLLLSLKNLDSVGLTHELIRVQFMNRLQNYLQTWQAWRNAKVPLTTKYLHSLTIVPPVAPVAAKSKSAARRARNKLARTLSTSIAQPMDVASSSFAQDDMIMFIESAAPKDDALERSSPLDTSKLSLSSQGEIEGSSLDPTSQG